MVELLVISSKHQSVNLTFLKETCWDFSFFLYFLKGKKLHVPTNRSSILPQKTLLLKRLASSPAFYSVTL